jgi:hypothetical protein
MQDLWYVIPVRDTQFGQSAVGTSPALRNEKTITVLNRKAGVRRSQLRTRASANIVLGKFAFHGYSVIWQAKKGIDTRWARLA